MFSEFIRDYTAASSAWDTHVKKGQKALAEYDYTGLGYVARLRIARPRIRKLNILRVHHQKPVVVAIHFRSRPFESFRECDPWRTPQAKPANPADA